MPGRIKALQYTNRTMQRLGYLKALCSRVNETETSNLSSIGKNLIDKVTSRQKLETPVKKYIREYVKARLTTPNYRELRKSILNGQSDQPVYLELQDIYLANPTLPSSTGKLVKANWEKYPNLGIGLGLIKKGTLSPLTRSLILLTLTPRSELNAFNKLDEDNNPLVISLSQAAVFLYCFIENDGHVIFPLFKYLKSHYQDTFDEREAGNLLPEILLKISKSYREMSVSVEERELLAQLSRSASSIAKWKDKTYTGGGAREEAIRVRLEPFCDIGFFSKPDKGKYYYEITHAFNNFMSIWQRYEDITHFLDESYFAALAASYDIEPRVTEEKDAILKLAEAGKEIQSTLGYSPITDVALLAGIRLLVKDKTILEISRSIALLKELQKKYPDFVRFTVDRMGEMAHVKFLKDIPGNEE